MLNKFKENKKIMEIKMDQASKMAVIAAFADTHDDIGGVAIIGFGRK